jgi:hypothetical protein
MAETHCVQRDIYAVPFEKLGMCAFFYDTTSLQHNDAVGSFDG